jgi:hypothetical protein
VVPEQSTLIAFDCEGCGHTIQVPDSYAGKTGRCPKCKNSVIVPGAHAEPLASEIPAQPEDDEDGYEAEAPCEDSAGPDRRRILIIAGSVTAVLVGLALAFYFWPSGSGPDAEPMASGPSQNRQATEPQPEQASANTPTPDQAVAPETGNAIRLQFNPASGTKRTMRVTRQHVTLHQMDEQSVEMKQTQSVTATLKPQAPREDGSMAIRVSLTQIQVKTESQGMAAGEYDSARPPGEDNMMSELYTPFVGKPFTISVSSQGKIVDSGLDELYLTVANDCVVAEDKLMSNPQSIERLDEKFGSRDGRIQNVKAQLETYPIFGGKQMRSLLEDLIVPLPASPIKENMSWDSTISVQAGMNVEVPATYTLTSLDEDAWLIEAQGERGKKEAPFVYEAGETTITNNLAGPLEIALIVDRRTGWLQHKEQKTELSGQVVRTRNGKRDANSVSNVTMELTTTVEFVE